MLFVLYYVDLLLSSQLIISCFFLPKLNRQMVLFIYLVIMVLGAGIVDYLVSSMLIELPVRLLYNERRREGGEFDD